ncbi:MAG: hypothetical protein O2819_04705 [Planctomycetota bacterium]|nr:hypothetical protein [Planctomycetota bacterium]
MPRMLSLTGAVLSLPICALALAQADPQLSEIRVDELGVDLNEYVEIMGAPGQYLDGYWYVVIGDNDFAFPPLQNGMVEVAIPLTGIIPASGYFVLAEASFTLGVADQYATFNLESPDNTTHLLVTNFSGSVGMDLDTNDDGTLDLTPWAAITDGVSFVDVINPDGVNADFYYYEAHTVGPTFTGSPAAAFRCLSDGTWTPMGDDPSSDTPHAANPDCGGAGGEFQLAEIRIDQQSTDNDEYVEITGMPGASLAGITLVAIGDVTPTGLPSDLQGRIESITDLSLATIQADGRLLVAEPTFTMGVADYTTAAGELNFENTDNVSFFLVSGFSGLMDEDLDADDNGVFDYVPWTNVFDEVAIVGLDTTLVYASSVVGPDGNYTPGQIARCETTLEWKIGPFNTTAGGDTAGEVNLACDAYPVLECGEATAGACDQVHPGPYCSDANCCTAVCSVDATCCSTGWDQACVDQAAISCGGATTVCDQGDVFFNEIRIDQTGTDLDEYIEIGGAPGTALTGFTIIVIGDGAGGSGVIERAFSLAAATIPEDGTLLIGNTGMVLGTPDVSSGVASNWLENSDNLTFFLVTGSTAVVLTDLDTNDDGVLDIIPWTAIVDEVAMIESATIPPTGTEWAYSDQQVGPDTIYVPGHVWRCQDSGCWNIGLFDPLAGSDTAGLANLDCEEPSCAADLDNSGVVDGQDLAVVLSSWGEALGDIDQNGQVDGADLAALLGSWGVCP